MKKIGLGGKRGVGLFALVDDGDYEMLSQYSWCLQGMGYAVARVDAKVRLMHRVLMGDNAPKFIDHINGNKLDNRRVNLRPCTASENLHNAGMRKHNTSGYKGVWFSREKGRRKRYVSNIIIDGKRVHLGHHMTAEDAARAYDKAAVERMGAFARTNAGDGLL